MALALIVFDCDGVLLESMDIKGRAFRRIGAAFGPELADRLALYHHMHGGVNRCKKFAWLYAEAEGRAITEAELEALNERFAAIILEEMQQCALVPGAREVLERWQGRAPLYVASGAPQGELRLFLGQRGLTSYFAGIFGAPPGKTQLLRSIIAHAGVRPADVVMVGDSRVDQQAAEAAQTRFYGRGELFKHSGHPWHRDLTGLNAHLEKLFHSP